MTPDLRLLRYAIAIGEERSFTRAAGRIGIAQPPLSQQISRLEAQLGFPLFVRGSAGVVPTPAGKTFIAHARLALERATQAVTRARDAANGIVGTLSLGLSGASMFSFLPPLLRDYRRMRPDVALDLHNVSADTQLAMLSEGRLDAGFMRPVAARSGYTQSLVHTEAFVAALPSDHRLASRKLIALGDLAEESFILFPDEGSGFHAEVSALCRAAGFVPSVVQTIAPMHAVIGLVSAGLGISIVPESVHIVSFEDVQYVRLRGLTRASRQFLVSVPARLSPVAVGFIAFVLQRTSRLRVSG